MPVIRAQLLEDMCNVGLHCPGTYHKAVSNHRVGQVLRRDEMQDFSFPLT
jgi:hypothetical protein